jgi:hypothetical protein
VYYSFIDFLKDTAKLKVSGLKPPNGILLYDRSEPEKQCSQKQWRAKQE